MDFGIVNAKARMDYDKIPKEWLSILKKKSYLEKISEKFYKSITECKKEKNQTL